MISAIRRRKTSEESSDAYFGTTNLIIDHFKRDLDKEKIFELIPKENTLTQLFLGASIIHLYHFLGIHIIDLLEFENVRTEETKNIELFEKKEFFKELEQLVDDSLSIEIEILRQENNLLIEVLKRVSKYRDEFPDNEKDDLMEILEELLSKILHNYPYVYFFDCVGDISGKIENVRQKIIKRSSDLKIISQSIEERLINEKHEDSYVELSVFNEVKAELEKECEFKSIKDLEMETLPLKLIIKKIISYLLNYFPISKRGLAAFHEAFLFKKEIIDKLSDINKTKTNYENFEYDIFTDIKNKILEISKRENSNYLIYFLEGFLNTTFGNITNFFYRIGITDIPEFVRLSRIEKKKFNNILKIYNINRMDINKLISPIRNPISRAKIEFEKLKIQDPLLKNLTLEQIFNSLELEESKSVLQKIAKRLSIKDSDLITIFKKKSLLENKVMNGLKLSNNNSMLLLYEYDELLQKLSSQIYYKTLNKIIRHMARILETIIKIKEDKSLLLLGLKRIQNLSETETWVKIKIEELVFQRLMERQKEFSIIFNAERDPFLVNGFIAARLLDIKLNDAIALLKDEPSPIYGDIKDLPLPIDIISPISYPLAFDLFERFKEFQENKKLKIELQESKEQEKREKKKEEIKKSQQANTLNWVERRITSAIMRITSKGINPTTLYWNDKDTQTCSDNMKLHSELPGKTTLERFAEFYYFALKQMKKLWPKSKLLEYNQIEEEVYQIIAEQLKKRINYMPKREEIDQKIIDGDRWNIANILSDKIGKKLDKILYKKFKTFLK